MSRFLNKVVRTMIISDFFLNCGWGLLGPIFAIFIVQNITVGNALEGAKVAGFASLFYWIIKSAIQIPISRHLDKNHGEIDDFWFMFAGTLLSGFVPLGFLISSLPWHIYFFQIVHAIGMAMAIGSWSAIFTRHIDKGKEAFDWSVESTSVGLGAGLMGALGGILVGFFGFQLIFIFASAFTIFSSLVLLLIRKDIFPKKVPPVAGPTIITPF